MKVIDFENNSENIVYEGIGVAIGKFDGLHMGHRNIVKRLKTLCKRDNLKSAIFTFKTHPKKVLSKKEFFLLTSNEIRERLIGTMGLDYLIYSEFNSDFAKVTPEDFVKMLSEKLNVKLIVVGKSFKFGHNKSGDIETLISLGSKYGISIEILEPVMFTDPKSYKLKTLSSQEIRELLLNGNIDLATKLLGRYYSVENFVTHGEGIGGEIGVKTINLKIAESLLCPANGVYITETKVDNKMYNSVTNIGYRPTFDGKERVIETHLLDVDKDFYGKKAEVFFVKRIREEKRFNSIEELIEQINNDIEFSKKHLKINKNILKLSLQ